MIIDTDVIIAYFRQSAAARDRIDAMADRQISAVTLMELLQGIRDKKELALLKKFLAFKRIAVVPLSETISNRAIYYMEKYGLSHALRLADALIAATAAEIGDPLFTGNHRHYRFIDGISVIRFSG